MPEFDLLIRGAEPLSEIAIADEKIAGFESGSARRELHAKGLQVFPGVIDSHVHFNEPGREEWEGIFTGSRAAAAGGTTTYFDMPLNAHPPTINGASFDKKLAAAEAKSLIDFCFWGGLVPGNVDELEALAERGVIGFKAFMSNSGIDDFPRVDISTLKDGMRRAAELRLPVAVHAEIDREISGGGKSVRDFIASRPIGAELEAIRIAIDLAAETGCPLHIVHVSCGRGIKLIAEAKARGVDVSCETCPHYLLLTGDVMKRLGAVAKCAPPLRDKRDQDELWRELRARHIDTIGSDHSPSPWSMKERDNFFEVWGGISSCQHLLPLLFDAGLDQKTISQLTAKNVAQRFRIDHSKGALSPGRDADLVLLNPKKKREIRREDLLYRHKHTPYAGRTLRGEVAYTIVRGQIVLDHGKIAAESRGRLIRPQ